MISIAIVDSGPLCVAEQAERIMPKTKVSHLNRPFEMPLLVAFACSLALPVCSAAVAGSGSTPWDEPFHSDTAAIARAAAGVPVAAGQPAAVLLSETVLTQDKAGRGTKTEREVYLVINADAVRQLGSVEQPWAPWFQARPEIRARVIAPDGTARWFDPRTIAEQENPEGGLMLLASLPAFGPGAVIEAEITMRETTPYYPRGVVHSLTFDWPIVCRRGRLVIDLPAATPFAWVIRGVPGQPPPREVRSGGRRRLEVELADIPPVREPEPGLPSTVPLYPYVAFATGASWGDIARSFAAFVDETIRGSDVTPLLQAAAGATSREDKIRRILTGMAVVQYRWLSGEYRIYPHSPAETLRSHTGDCKDMAVLLVAALRASDIPASVVFVSPGEGTPDLEESLPGLGSFSHMIVVVPGAPALWIDPTDPYVRLGEVPAPSQGRLALIIDPATTGLTRIPESTSADNRLIVSREFYLAPSGPARVVETTEYKGTLENAFRTYYAITDPETLGRELKQYAENTYLAPGAIISVPPLKDFSRPFQVTRTMPSASRGTTVEDSAIVALLPAEMLRLLPTELAEALNRRGNGPRMNDFCFNHPYTVELHTRAVPPPGFRPAPPYLPPSRSWKLGTATFEEHYEASAAGEIVALWQFDTGKRCMSPRELTEMMDAVDRFADTPPAVLVFEQLPKGEQKGPQISAKQEKPLDLADV
jgi:transglutaminase-like putative cysteine protease